MRALRDVQILLCNEICAVFQLRGGQVAKPLRWTNERGVVSIAGIVRCGVSGVTASKHHDFSYRAYRTVVLPLLACYSRVTKYLCVCRTRTRVRSIQKRRDALIRVAFCACVHYFARYAHAHAHTIVTRTCTHFYIPIPGIYIQHQQKIKKKFFFNVHSFMHNEVEHHTFIRMATTML